MSFIGGIVQGILGDALKEFILKERTNQESWGCAGLILLIAVGGLILLGLLVGSVSRNTTPKDLDVWKGVKVGDSLFVREAYGIKFYKKGLVKLRSYEQREIKYAYDKALKFIDVNRVNDRFFFKNKTSFIGIYAGMDSVTDGSKWFVIKPSNAVSHPPKPKDDYDYETRRWENKKYDILNECKLSEEFYVRVSDVIHINNDNLFN